MAYLGQHLTDNSHMLTANKNLEHEVCVVLNINR